MLSILPKSQCWEVVKPEFGMRQASPQSPWSYSACLSAKSSGKERWLSLNRDHLRGKGWCEFMTQNRSYGLWGCIGTRWFGHRKCLRTQALWRSTLKKQRLSMWEQGPKYEMLHKWLQVWRSSPTRASAGCWAGTHRQNRPCGLEFS